MDRPRNSELTGTDPPVLQRQVTSKASTEPTRNDSISSMDSDSESDLLDRPPVDSYVEEGELSDQDQYVSITDLDQSLSEEQTYRETMRRIQSNMGWSHIPDMDTTVPSGDNHFACPKVQAAGTVNSES